MYFSTVLLITERVKTELNSERVKLIIFLKTLFLASIENIHSYNYNYSWLQYFMGWEMGPSKLEWHSVENKPPPSPTSPLRSNQAVHRFQSRKFVKM